MKGVRVLCAQLRRRWQGGKCSPTWLLLVGGLMVVRKHPSGHLPIHKGVRSGTFLVAGTPLILQITSYLSSTQEVLGWFFFLGWASYENS